MKKVRSLFISLLIALALTAMPESHFLPGTLRTVSAAHISSRKLTLLTGQKKTLAIEGTTKTPKWSSSRKAVATVSSSGKVSAKKEGSAVITARIRNRKFTCKVTVQKASISARSVSITKGSRHQLRISGTNQKVTWTSTNSHIASISSSGLVFGKRVGTCKVYGEVLGRRYTCRITVKNPVQSSQNASAGQPADSTAGQPANTAGQTSTVWLSATGTKYHRIPNCGRMNPNTARQVSLAQAQASGYSPCSKCF